MEPFRFHLPTEIVFGADSVASLRDHVRRFDGRPLVVTGKSSARLGGSLDVVMDQLRDAALIEGIEENPRASSCDDLGVRCREERCAYVIALGGGSAMDAAKAIAVRATNPGPCAEYYGLDRYVNAPLPLIAIPTTSGTGSEVTPYSVVVDDETRSKRTIAGKGLYPVAAIVDPKLTLSMPKHVTIHTGLDALSQVMEGLVSVKSTPMTDVWALQGCEILAMHLPRVIADGSDLEARSEVMYAAMLSGAVVAMTGTTLVHGMGYAYTTEFGIAHGLANALLLTPLFRYDAAYLPDRVARICSILDEGPTHAGKGLRERVTNAIHAFLAKLDVSPAAKDWGVDGTRLEEFARAICADATRSRNQVGKPSLADVETLYRESYEGV